MITTCKELAEILLQTPEKRIKVSVDDGTGLQCDANVLKVKDLGEIVSIIPEEPEILD